TILTPGGWATELRQYRKGAESRSSHNLD
ncbi:hypothetical protein PMI22_01592, partial [Pseudomonas sp. GM21]